MSGATEQGIPLATCSGIASTDAAMIDWFARETIAQIITTKSIQLHPNPGNREPVITAVAPGSFGNAVGLRNPGVEATVRAMQQLRARRAAWPGPTRLNISLAGNSLEEFALLAERLLPYADLLELNFSCPHAHGGYGTAIGTDPSAVGAITAAVVAVAGDVPVYPKLTPNVVSIGAIAQAAVTAGAAGIVAINTVGPDVYIEPHSGASILSNPPEGRGGRSGAWVHQRALECMREIRDAIGPAYPIIGMGGVDSRVAAEAMIAAGATVVGVGSALALYHQRDWPQFFRALALGETPPPRTRMAPARRSPFVPYRVASRRDLDDRLFELELETAYRAPPPPATRFGLAPEVAPGRTYFLWLPGVGEKPFAPFGAHPLRFLIARRGPLTNALGALKKGDPLYLRGPYGDAAPLPAAPESARLAPTPATAECAASQSAARATRPAAHILTAGTGSAALPALTAQLQTAGFTVQSWVGLRDEATALPAAVSAGTTVVHDRGEQGRVIAVWAAAVRAHAAAAVVYAVGPTAFMERIAATGQILGMSLDSIWFSLEHTMLCGVGLCGACHCAGRLTCQYGTFVTAADYAAHRAGNGEDA